RSLGDLPFHRRTIMTARLPFSMAGRRVLYTGAAGGLGLQTTLAMLDTGPSVIALDHNAASIERLRAQATPSQAANLEFVQADLQDEAGLQAQLLRLTAAATIDVVINNAAIYPSMPFEQYSAEQLRRVHRVNVEAA